MTRLMPKRSLMMAVTLLPMVASASIPVAHCRPGDKTESGISGDVTQAEIDSGAVTKGFNCNADIVGQYQGEGASWQLTAWKNCAYFDQRRVTTLAHPGTAVVDVTDPAHPVPTVWLAENAMLDPWESLKVNPARQLLAATEQGRNGFAIYDISADCKHPVLKFAAPIVGNIGHTGQWAPDGRTYYVTPLRASPSVIVIDTIDPTNAQIIPCGQGTPGCNTQGFYVNPATGPGGNAISPVVHDLEFSKDGNTAYLSTTGTPNGLVILDVSDFQQRRPNPGFRIIGSLGWNDGSRGAQNALPITIKGKPYILFSDESGAQAGGCASGMSANGFARLIDISDPTKPTTAAKMILDVNDPAFCAQMATEQSAGHTTRVTANGPSFGFSSHYCNVDDVDDAKIAACSYFSAGWRFFDISDPSYVREIAYLKPPAQGTKVLLGSQYFNSGGATWVRQYDWATSKASFPKDRGMTSGDVWITSQDNGFMVVKLDANATAGSGGGCASIDAGLGGLIALGLAQLLRRRKSRSAA
jgi:hypothetical protein